MNHIILVIRNQVSVLTLTGNLAQAIQQANIIPILLISFPDDNWHVSSSKRDITVGGITFTSDSRIIGSTLPTDTADFAKGEFRVTFADEDISSPLSWHNRLFSGASGKKIEVGVCFNFNESYTDKIVVFTGIVYEVRHVTPRGLAPQTVVDCINGFPKNTSVSSTRTTREVQRARSSNDNSLDFVDRSTKFKWGA